MEHALESWIRRAGVEAVFAQLAALVPGHCATVLDADGRVVWWSPEAERVFGWTGRELTGRPPPDGVGTGTASGGEVRVRRADGGTVPACQHWQRVTAADGSAAGSIHLLVSAAADPTGLPLPADAVGFHGLLTRDPAMIRVLQTIRNVAETEATVLVRGESGTGKELVARAIHTEGPRRDRPFVAVNCASLSPSLLESELFGHAKGAFTGAIAAREGIFAQADGGTLFLDEVAEIPLELQAKLLRVLQERTFVPVGSNTPRKVDVRIIAATHRALREQVRAGRFREDLMYRLRVVVIFLPALRERRLDVELLLRHQIEAANAKGPRRITRIAPNAMRALLDHTWPGNVRELQNVVAYAFAVGRGPELVIDELPPEFREAPLGKRIPVGLAPPTAPSPDADALRDALSDGDLTAAAERLGVSRTTLWRMRKRHGL